MLEVKNISAISKPWFLSNRNDRENVFVNPEIIKKLNNCDILGIDFLYRNYKRELLGAILNEEPDMNVQLQVSVFIHSVLKPEHKKGILLILSPDHHIPKWIYHLTRHGGLRTKIVNGDTCPEEFIAETDIALILSFNDIKLAESLQEYNYFSVIMDDFDKICTKLAIRKLRGSFNIGLSERNFYGSPDQKLQWSMLNWCHPGSVGKLGDFYMADSDSFANLRDNYCLWWFRLTWSFCENFVCPSAAEKNTYTEELHNWLNENGYSDLTKNECRKRKITRTEKPQKSKSNKKNNITEIKEEILVETESESSSSDTIIEENYIQLPSMDEVPIVTSIISNLREHSVPCKTHDNSRMNCDAEVDNNILLSIIKTEKLDQGSSKSVEGYSLKEDQSNIQDTNSSEHDFFKKLFAPEKLNCKIKENSDGIINKELDTKEPEDQSTDIDEEDLEKVLEQADALLKNS